MSETANAHAMEQHASGSSFYAAMRLMPKAEREAMFAIYAFCRAVDDISDTDTLARPARQKALDAWRQRIEQLYDGAPAPDTAFLAAPVRRYGLRKADFLTVIDGMEMDVAADIRAPDLATLELYCDRVASAVGRLSVKVFGMEDETGFTLAHHLGRALQLTNILRDIDEDAAAGRVYLPREILNDAGIDGLEPAEIVAHPSIDHACRAVSRLARTHYRNADLLLRARPVGRLSAPRLMEAVYSRLLTKMEREGWLPPRKRVRLAKARLLFLALRYKLAG